MYIKYIFKPIRKLKLFVLQIFTQKDTTIRKLTLKSEINKCTQYLITAGDGLYVSLSSPCSALTI